jgi:hypothetical protein
MEGRGEQERRGFGGDGRAGRGPGGAGQFFDQRHGDRPWEGRRGVFRGRGRPQFQQWRQREFERHQNQYPGGEHNFDLRQNISQNRNTRVQDEERPKTLEQENKGQAGAGVQDTTGTETSGRNENLKRKEVEKGEAESKESQGVCQKCGKVGHKSEECYKPVICNRCKKEGHISRVCSEIAPWEHIAPFCGLAAPELGFHIIQDEDSGDGVRDSSNFALITIKEGVVSARQVEGEFKAQAGPNSTWRWFAKKVAENKFQMKFPTEKKWRN